MPRFFLHVRSNGHSVIDREGTEFADLEAALREAVRGAREIVAARIQSGETIEDEVIDVTDSDGVTVASVRLIDQVRLPSR
jgi:uncharacterized protein DUF6894